MPDPARGGIYRPRKPQDSQYYQCIEDHFEEFERIYDDCFPKKYGFLWPYVKNVIYRYPWPRPGLVCQLQGPVYLGMNTNIEFKMDLVAPGRAWAHAPISRPTVAPTIPPGGIAGFCLTHKPNHL
jgi:hypothetical protein